jgi:hypothetical protein
LKDLLDIADALDIGKPMGGPPRLSIFDSMKEIKKYDKLSNAVHNLLSDEEECTKPIPGTPVYCNLAVVAEHTGIYIGNNEIVHLSGDGNIEIVSPAEFVGRLDGLNPAVNIYFATYKGKALGNRTIADRTRAMVGSCRNYSVAFDNCHQFTCGCISGDFENPCNFFWMVEAEIRNKWDGLVWQNWSYNHNNSCGRSKSVKKEYHQAIQDAADELEKTLYEFYEPIEKGFLCSENKKKSSAKASPTDKFLLSVSNVANITGRGFCCSGLIESGRIRIGDFVDLCDSNNTVIEKGIKILGIEKSRHLIEEAHNGDSVFILLSNCKSAKICPQMIKKMINSSENQCFFITGID